jgi:hypothetical protein
VLLRTVLLRYAPLAPLPATLDWPCADHCFQRAFRQRKEEYIKSLKDQVKEYEQLSETYKAVQAENYQLRDYIISLQSRLLEAHASIPPPPENIDLTRPNPLLEQHGTAVSSTSAPAAPMTHLAMQLQQAAAQATAHEAGDRTNQTKTENNLGGGKAYFHSISNFQDPLYLDTKMYKHGDLQESEEDEEEEEA